MDAKQVLGLGALVLMLVGCGTAEPSEPEQEPTVTAAAEAAPEPSVTAAAEAAPEPPPEPERRQPEDRYLEILKEVADNQSVSLGSADDAALIAAGHHACDVYDIDGSYRLAASLTVTDLPDDLDPDGHYFVALAAASELCPDHWERVQAESMS